MPLKKPGSTAVVTPPAETTMGQVAAVVAAAEAKATVTPKAAPKISAPKDKASDKESYWTNKEERDIETGKRIRRSGVWQAALQSMAGLQFNQGGTLESFLDLVDKMADRGLDYVNKD